MPIIVKARERAVFGWQARSRLFCLQELRNRELNPGVKDELPENPCVLLVHSDNQTVFTST